MYGKTDTPCIFLTQIAQNTARAVDKVAERCIIVRSRNSCPKHKIHKTIKQSRPHEPAAKKGCLEAFAGGCRASLVQNFFCSGTLRPLCFFIFTAKGGLVEAHGSNGTARLSAEFTPQTRLHPAFPASMPEQWLYVGILKGGALSVIWKIGWVLGKGRNF